MSSGPGDSVLTALLVESLVGKVLEEHGCCGGSCSCHFSMAVKDATAH